MTTPTTMTRFYIVSQEKNDTDVTHYNFNAHQPIWVIIGTVVANRVCYRTVCVMPSPLTTVSALPGGNMNSGNCLQ